MIARLRLLLQSWLGVLRLERVVAEEVLELQAYLTRGLQHEHLPANFHMRLTAIEATLKRVHDRVEALGALPMGEVTMAEAAEAEADRKILADKERRDRSAAEARGMSLTEYYADVQRRHMQAVGAEKESQS